MVTLKLTNADAKMVAEALRKHRNSNNARARWLTGSTQRGMARRKERHEQTGIKADRLMLRINAKLGE